MLSKLSVSAIVVCAFVALLGGLRSLAAKPVASSPAVPVIASYDGKRACIDHVAYVNDVLPSGVGEFATNGLDRAYWGGRKHRTVPVTGNNDPSANTWGPGFYSSWGRHQYDTYWADPSDGLGMDPFYVGPDTAAPGSPKALRIAAFPTPPKYARDLRLMANDQYIVTSATVPFRVPADGGSLTVTVSNPNAAQNKWWIGIGYRGGAITFIGKLVRGGATPSGNGTGGANPWTIENVKLYSGTPGTLVSPGANDEGGFRAYQFPEYVSGDLDTNVDRQYGFFVSRVRIPEYLPALSPAFWMLSTGGHPIVNASPYPPLGGTYLQKNEDDIMEEGANTWGNAINSNQIGWNRHPDPEGVGPVKFPYGTPQADYHDYGVLKTPKGVSFYTDGKPNVGDTNLRDLTQGSTDNELMLMFQIGAPGSWLDGARKARDGNPWPQYFWSQWIRVYAPTAAPC